MSARFESVTGGCFCGAIRYEAEANSKEAYFCHCKGCQKRTGTPAHVGVFVNPESLTYNEDGVSMFQTSSFGFSYFCKTCGSRVIWKCPDHPEWTNVAVGTLDHPEHAVPVRHICVESQIPWYQPFDDLPKERCDEDSA